MENEKRKCCCFTGHRPEKLGIPEAELKEKLQVEIDNAIADGYTDFMSGMARGVDIWAAELVLAKKRENNNIRLICASPFEGFEKKWTYSEKLTYRKILNEADLVEFVSAHYSPYCFHMRNYYMVNNSQRVIAVFNGERGGTYNTIRYAREKGAEIVNIL